MRHSIFCSLLLFSLAALAQEGPGPDRARGESMRNMDRLMGEVVSVGSDRLVVKNETGDQVTVTVGSNARIRKNRQEAKLSDFNAGDHVLVFGKFGSDKTTLAAAGVMGGEMRGFGPGGAPPSIEEMQKMGLGTKFIAGEVKSIDETKLTILRPDGQTQTIEVNENTSFQKGRGESVTLADIKVGDRVMGRGEMKNGVFVPQNLRVGAPGGRNRMEGGPEPVPAPPSQQEQPR
jgi:preprotein translocase subunit YajC